MDMKKLIIVAIIVLAILGGWLYFVKGYIGVVLRHAVPAPLMEEARIPGMEHIRLIADPMKFRHMNPSDMIKSSGLILGKFNHPHANILAISGGGANGAYAAGVLCGWTEAGTRPEFDIVTGVSTGALIAPAAFLGSEYDNVIRGIYTNVSDADIAKQNIKEFFLEGRPSLLDSRPLRAILKQAVSKEVIEAVAREHKKGRRLYVATTNLDARRLVIWDMGAIASSGSPQAAEIFREVMLASASIPVALPPVMIPVEAGGRKYEEMHVDGSVATQMIGAMLITSYDDAKRKKTNVYVIRNGKIADVPEEVKYKVWDIAGAAFSTLMTWQSYGEIYRFASIAKYEKFKLYFTCIPYTFNEPRKGEFDLVYMRKLFYRGYKEAISGNNWLTRVGSHMVKAGPEKVSN